MLAAILTGNSAIRERRTAWILRMPFGFIFDAPSWLPQWRRSRRQSLVFRVEAILGKLRSVLTLLASKF